MNISNIWNTSIEQKEERAITPRNRIWASELGKANIDIYLKMKGVEVTNPFDARAKRKFEAGNLFEWIIKLVFQRCGIYQLSQEWVGNSEYGLDVSGKLDHLIGGQVDYEKSKKEIEALGLPELFTRSSEKIIEYFATNYPNGIPVQGVEVKSTSSFGIEKVYATEKAMAGHDLQAFHYAYNKNIPFTLIYICRDDLRMAEIPIEPDSKELLDRYKAKIEKVAGYYHQNIEPPLEPAIIFDETVKRFSKNYNIEYSSYLTRNYKFINAQEFNDKYGPIVEAFNRVLGRIEDGKELTENNKLKLGLMTEMGFDIDYLKEALCK
jgi:hypothetical protein